MTDNNKSAQAQISLIQYVFPGNTSATPMLVICKYISPSEKFVIFWLEYSPNVIPYPAYRRQLSS